MQRAVSKSIIKEIKEQQISFESDISNTCDFIAWNARKLCDWCILQNLPINVLVPANKTKPFKSLPHIKQERRQCIPKKLSVTFVND